MTAPTPEELAREIDVEEHQFQETLEMNTMLGDYRRNAITAGRRRAAQRALYPAVYSETRFRAPHSLDWGGTAFVIITACARTGRRRDAEAERGGNGGVDFESTCAGRAQNRLPRRCVWRYSAWWA